jgi:hypothetical protein
VSKFLEQYKENLREHHRRLPQRLLKVVIVIGIVVILAPCTAVAGKAFGPPAALVVAFCGFFATLLIWWLASTLLFPQQQASNDLSIESTAFPGPPVDQPQTTIASATLPPQMPPVASQSNVLLAVLAITGVLFLSCCGGCIVLAGLVGTAKRDRPARNARPETRSSHSPNAPLEESIKRQEQQLRQLEEELKERQRIP